MHRITATVLQCFAVALPKLIGSKSCCAWLSWNYIQILDTDMGVSDRQIYVFFFSLNTQVPSPLFSVPPNPPRMDLKCNFEGKESAAGRVCIAGGTCSKLEGYGVVILLSLLVTLVLSS